MRSLFAGNEPIANPRVGHDVTRFGGIGLDLLTQMPNEDAQIFGLLDRVSTPICAEEIAMGQDLSRMTNEVDEQVEFFLRKPYFSFAHEKRASIKGYSL